MQNAHCHSKMVKWGSSEGILGEIKPSWENSKSCSCRSYVKRFRWLCPSSINTAPRFSLLSLYAALPDRHPASPTSWHLQRNPGFRYTVSHCLSGLPRSTCLPHTWPWWRKTPQPLYFCILPDTKARGMWTALPRPPAPWITAEAAFIHCYYLEEENSLSLFFSQAESLGRVLPWDAPMYSNEDQTSSQSLYFFFIIGYDIIFPGTPFLFKMCILYFFYPA